jgi:hypothetical protein
VSSAPFDTGLVIERIRDGNAVLSELREVAGAASYAAIKSLRDFPSPAAYVLLARERGEPHSGGRQKVGATLGIALVVRNYRGECGEAGKEDLNRFLGALRDRVIGWTPELPGARPFQFVQGDLVDYDDATLLWVDVYTTQHFIGAGQ